MLAVLKSKGDGPRAAGGAGRMNSPYRVEAYPHLNFLHLASDEAIKIAPLRSRPADLGIKLMA